MKTLITILLGCAAGSSVALAAPPQYKGHELARNAKVTIEQARAIALKARPGKITDQELEREAGGSGLRYSFDIKSAGKSFEVGVDAVTGKILENGSESPVTEVKEELREHVRPHTH